jgi:hypothetical protein
VLLLLLAVVLWPRGSSKLPLARAAEKASVAAASGKSADTPVGSTSAAPRTTPAATPKTVAPAVPKPEPKQEVKPEAVPPPRSRWAPVEGKGIEKAEDFAKRTEGLELSSVEDYIVTWQYAGPYREEGKQGPQGLFDVVFPPEKELAGTAPPAGEAPKWAPLPTRSDPTRPWLFDFKRMEGIYAENVAIYLRTRVNSPRKQELELWAGSDDGIKVWLNRQQVHGNNAARAVGPDSDKVKVTLDKGWNDLLVKITQGNGDWAFCLRFRTLEGQKLEGIKVDPMGK